MLDGHMKVRVSSDMRIRFVSACHQNGVAATKVLREAMNDYVAKHQQNTAPSIPIPVDATPDQTREVLL